MTTGSNDRPALCAGLKVLDLSWGVAGPIAGMVLSDFGAEVIKIEPPGGDPFRSMPGAVQWHRGKKSVVLDLKDAKQREQAQQLAASADVLIESFRPGVADRLGVGYGALSRINPRLVYCSITGFGTKGPWRNLKAYEGVVSARGGYFAGQKVGWRAPGPVYLVAKQVSYGATNYALQGIFGALRRRLTTGHGDRVETNLLQGGVAFQINTTYKWKDASKTPARTAPPDAADPLSTVACYRICRCSDGKWIQLGAFQSDIFHRMMVALGMDEESKDLRYVDAPQFKSDEDRLRIIKRLEEQIAKKPYAHWAAAFEKMDCPYSPHLSTQEALDDVQVRAIGLVVNVDDPVQGKTEQVGAPFVIADSGWRVHGPAPLVGQHNGQGFATSSKTSHVARNGRANGFMLDGVKVLDVTTYVAAPTATGYLVDYGADVIKVEPPGGDPQNNWGDVGTRPNRGKRSIWLDLKHEKGREVLYKMVEKTDIFLQNFRPGVDQRLGIDFDTLIKINPRLVYCHAASYGSTGPYSKRGAFDPVVTALMGGTVAQAGKGNPPVIHFTSDLGAGVTTATAMLMALYQRDRTGKGQRIESRMLSAAAYLHSDDFIRYAGMPTRRIADKGQYGLNALYRLYPAAEGWVFLAAPLETEWEAFCKATGKAEWLRDDRFRTLEARAANDEALIALLAGLFKTKPATDWERLLTPLDVACVVAHEDFGAMLFQNDNMREAVGHLTGTHPTFGEFTQAGPLVRLASVPTVSRLQSFTSGQNTADVLRSLGFPTENMPMPRQEAVSG